ncbi:hypothetical protein [Lysobacter antibioticus]|uniref:hypothetical protein n=1 Tax=Lysobacter antibioticus TaxID=84531 RepID=UPI000349C9DE|nr:hypothetical protein [Lysobacter antibioticus]
MSSSYPALDRAITDSLSALPADDEATRQRLTALRESIYRIVAAPPHDGTPQPILAQQLEAAVQARRLARFELENNPASPSPLGRFRPPNRFVVPAAQIGDDDALHATLAMLDCASRLCASEAGRTMHEPFQDVIAASPPIVALIRGCLRSGKLLAIAARPVATPVFDYHEDSATLVVAIGTTAKDAAAHSAIRDRLAAGLLCCTLPLTAQGRQTAMRRIMLTLRLSPKLLGGVAGAVVRGTLKTLGELRSRPGTIALYSPQLEAIHLDISAIAKHRSGSGDVPLETLVRIAQNLGHEAQHALNICVYRQARQSYYERYAQHPTLTAGALPDYTEWVHAYLSLHRWDEAHAEIAGWNAGIGLAQRQLRDRDKALNLCYRCALPLARRYFQQPASGPAPIASVPPPREGLQFDANYQFAPHKDNVEAMGRYFYDESAAAPGRLPYYPNLYAHYALFEAIDHCRRVTRTSTPRLRIDFKRLRLDPRRCVVEEPTLPSQVNEVEIEDRSGRDTKRWRFYRHGGDVVVEEIRQEQIDLAQIFGVDFARQKRKRSSDRD